MRRYFASGSTLSRRLGLKYLHRTDAYCRRQCYKPVGPTQGTQNLHQRGQGCPSAVFKIFYGIERNTGLFGKLALIGHVGTQEKSADAFAARLSDALIGEHGVLVAVDGEKGAIFRWPAPDRAEPLAATGVALGRAPIRLAIGGAEYRVIAADMETVWGQTAHVVVGRDIRHHTDFLDQLQHDSGWLSWPPRC